MRTCLPLLLILGHFAGLHMQDDLRPTLPELARQSDPVPVYQSRTRDLVLESLDVVLRKSELVLYGRVEEVDTYLSVDQKDLYTDYVIRPLRLIHPAVAPTQTRPGLARLEPIVVTRWGGRMTIEGVQVTQEDANVPAFVEGQELVLLLSSTGKGKYRLPSPVSGTFVVIGSKMEPWAKNVGGNSESRRMKGMTVSEFEAEVQRIARSSNR